MRATIASIAFIAGLIAALFLISPLYAAATTQNRSTTMADQNDLRYSEAGYDITPLSPERVEQLASKLDPETYEITQRSGTEPAFCGNLLDNKKQGIYACVVCDLPLFSSKSKFTSGSGWPSFFQPVDDAHVAEKQDLSFGMIRTEIACARCDSHLGHVFDDGPKPTGRRHCVNSASLTFFEDGSDLPDGAKPVEREVAYFAAGCFWGIEHYLQQGPGVINAESGYMQGTIDNPTYEDVISKRSGHAESVKVTFDPNRISFDQLLQAFFKMHDPTQLNRQGPDIGEQYRSGIYFATEAQQRSAEAMIKSLTNQGAYSRPIVTEVEKAKTFYPAEDYHQDYIAKTGRACWVTNPWPLETADAPAATE